MLCLALTSSLIFHWLHLFCVFGTTFEFVMVNMHNAKISGVECLAYMQHSHDII